MKTAATLRRQIETTLANRVPSALTPAPRLICPVFSTGIAAVDELLHGGLPLGAITEVVGTECSGRTALAICFLAQVSRDAKVCAWVDVSDALHPESAAAAGIDLARLLWVRCGVATTTEEQPTVQAKFALPEKYFVPPSVKKGLHGGGFGPHPRGEVKGLSNAISGLLHPEAIAPRCAEPQRTERNPRKTFEPTSFQNLQRRSKNLVPTPWSRIDQALRVVDLLLQAGGFSAIVLDLGDIAPEYASRIPLATWFRYRAAAERTQASILLLTQYPCAKSSAGLVLRMQGLVPRQDERTVFTGMEHQVETERDRFASTPSKFISLRKPPESERQATWRSKTTWAGHR